MQEQRLNPRKYSKQELFSMIFRSSRHFLGILFKSKGKRKTNPGDGPRFWPKASRPSWLAARGACLAERSRGVTPHPSLRPKAAYWPRRSARGWGATGVWLPCAARPPWRRQRGLTSGLCRERWTARVRRECKGRAGQGEVCHGSPRWSGVDKAVESGTDMISPSVYPW
jgi:hypothetical protein